MSRAGRCRTRRLAQWCRFVWSRHRRGNPSGVVHVVAKDPIQITLLAVVTALLPAVLLISALKPTAVLALPVVLPKSAPIPVGRVTVASGIVKKRSIPIGRVAGTCDVDMEDKRSIGRIVKAGGVD